MTRRSAAVIVTAVAVSVLSVVTALAVTLGRDEGDAPEPRGGMMTAPWQSRPDWRQSDWHHPSWMAPGMAGAHRLRVRSEQAYLSEMVAHHWEAVRAAEQLRRSERRQMRNFGAAIVVSQSAQIEQMQRWMADWYSDRSEPAPYQPMMQDLNGLSGDRLDRVFLQDMIVHHMGAVMMSQQVLMRGLAEHPQVAALARSIRDEQHTEIFQMQRWLREWFA